MVLYGMVWQSIIYSKVLYFMVWSGIVCYTVYRAWYNIVLYGMLRYVRRYSRYDSGCTEMKWV